MRERLVRVVRYWVPIAVAVTGLCFLFYLTQQQTLRQGLNDPQLQLAQDAASRLVDGSEAKSVVGGRAVDIAASLSPWVMLYDQMGKPQYGAAQLEGTVTAPPKGVFEYARAHGENRVTWQPRSDVRVAIVVEYWRNTKASGFVVSGRNMRDIEARIDTLGTLVLGGWAAILIASLGAMLLFLPGPAPSPRPFSAEEE